MPLGRVGRIPPWAPYPALSLSTHGSQIIPETWFTQLRHLGDPECPGRSVNRWTNDFDLSRDCSARRVLPTFPPLPGLREAIRTWWSLILPLASGRRSHRLSRMLRCLLKPVAAGEPEASPILSLQLSVSTKRVRTIYKVPRQRRVVGDGLDPFRPTSRRDSRTLHHLACPHGTTEQLNQSRT